MEKHKVIRSIRNGTAILCILLQINGFAQVEELKKAQDTRKNYIDPSIASEKKFSKSLYVNPFIGTGGHGHTYPGASMPFGMIQLSPDTRHEGWDGCSGYHYSDSIIYGFSHTHLSGTGVPDYCDLLINPQIGKPKIEPGYVVENGYAHSFRHDKEKAEPGYYEVELDEGDISVRLSVSERAGFHEYTFNNPKGKKFIVIDLDHRDKVLCSEINLIDKTRFSGKRISRSWADEQHFNFYIELNTPYQKARTFFKDGKNKLLLIFPKATKKISLKVGISATDIAGAKLNLEHEIPHWDFDQLRADASKAWNMELDKIYFYTPDKEVMTNFYTALYHSYLNPNVFSDVDGKYRGRDNNLHQIEELRYPQYTVFSLWDTYRATHPLFTLTQQYRTQEFMKTFLRQFKEGGDLPVWELAGNETECMIGYHSVSVIADACTKGLINEDLYELMMAMMYTSNLDEFGKHDFIDKGFISTGNEPESVSKTLEYAYDDFCIAQMIDYMKKNHGVDSIDYLLDEYRRRSLNFINVFDPQTKFMRGRRSGIWFSPFDPAEVNFNYTEANSWQYSLYAPHAVGVLTNLLGGKDSLELWLDRLFNTQSNLSGRHQVDITGLIGQYAHGNEPSHHMAYLYNYTNNPSKTQAYTDEIMRTMYSNAPDGLSGNEDCGQMSSWYVLSALGIYQIAPGSPYFDIGRPLMNEASLKLENGKVLVINTKNNSLKNKYVQRILINDKAINRSYIKFEELNNGGTITFEMGSKPKTTKLEHAPTINSLVDDFVPAPYFVNTNRVFEDSMLISIDVIDHDSLVIMYTTDGTDPRRSPSVGIYTQPFSISNSSEIKAFAANGKNVSSLIENNFVKKDPNVSITIQSTYANQYAANGPMTLIDGIRGGDEYRTGDWQGYWDQDFEASISFANPVTLSEVGVGCLSDMKSWIFLPSHITFNVHYEGSSDIDILEFQMSPEPESEMFPHHYDYRKSLDPSRKIKQIDVKMNKTVNCPAWHLGAGNPTWLFIDEIFFK